MLDYTIAAGKKVWNNIKILSLVLNLTVQAVSILILLYTMICGDGVLGVSIALLVLSVAYMAFYCTSLKISIKKELKRRIKIIFKWSRRAIKLVNLGIMLYIFLGMKNPSMLDTVLLITSIGFWVLDLLVELAAIIVRSWGLLLFEGIKTDFANVTKPFRATGNFFNKMVGKEVAPEQPPNKYRTQLDELVAIAQAEKRSAKVEQKAEKKQRKLEKKAAILAAKLAKNASRIPDPSLVEEIAPAASERQRKREEKAAKKAEKKRTKRTPAPSDLDENDFFDEEN